jgi:hypothetical protein
MNRTGRACSPRKRPTPICNQSAASTSSPRSRRGPTPRRRPHTVTIHIPGPARCTNCRWRPGRSMPGCCCRRRHVCRPGAGRASAVSTWSRSAFQLSQESGSIDSARCNWEACAIKGHTLASVQVERQRIRALQVGIAGENGKLARRVIEVDAQNGESAGRDRTFAKSNSNRSGLAFTLQLKVTQAAFQHDLRIASRALSAQDRQRERTVGRKAGHASVFKLDLCRPSSDVATWVPSNSGVFARARSASTSPPWEIRTCPSTLLSRAARIACAASSARRHCAIRIVPTANAASPSTPAPGIRFTNHPSAIPYAIHGFPPSQCPMPA